MAAPDLDLLMISSPPPRLRNASDSLGTLAGEQTTPLSPRLLSPLAYPHLNDASVRDKHSDETPGTMLLSGVRSDESSINGAI